MKKFLMDILTEPDNCTYDITRLLTLLGGLVMLIAQIVSVYKSGTFDAIAFGTGYSALMAGSGLGIGLKSKMEAKNDTRKDN